MSDFNDILAKHFAGETSTEEETQVLEWKVANQEEYALLAEAWSAEPVESTHVYDAKGAWDKIDLLTSEEQLEDKGSKVIKMRRFKFIAAAACGILLIGLGLKFLTGGFGDGMVEINNDTASIREVSLPDGSEVSLAPHSNLKYANDFESNRNVELEGQAYFEVARDEAHPFVITTEKGEIEVLGTAFNVRCEAKGTTVSVEHGLVAVRNEGDEVKLSENQSAMTSDEGVSEVASNDINYLSWKTGSFEFTQAPLPKVIDQLNQFYKKQIKLEGDHLNDIELTASFDNLPFEEAIDIIEIICDVNSEEVGDEVILK